VRIMSFEITKVTLPEVFFRVECSTGTYIRSLANDLGAALGCGGYLQELRRTKIGEFNVADALTVAQWVKGLNPEAIFLTSEEKGKHKRGIVAKDPNAPD